MTCGCGLETRKSLVAYRESLKTMNRANAELARVKIKIGPRKPHVFCPRGEGYVHYSKRRALSDGPPTYVDDYHDPRDTHEKVSDEIVKVCNRVLGVIREPAVDRSYREFFSVLHGRKIAWGADIQERSGQMFKMKINRSVDQRAVKQPRMWRAR